MPKIKYALFHCDKDDCVNKEMHSGRLYEAMRDMDITYRIVKGRGRCDLGEEMYQVCINIVLKHFS